MQAAGVAAEQIAIDPGPDFDKGVDDTIELVGRIPELQELGRPVMAAISRKDYLGAVMAGSWDARPDADERGRGDAGGGQRSRRRRAPRSCGSTIPRRSMRCAWRRRSRVADIQW